MDRAIDQAKRLAGIAAEDASALAQSEVHSVQDLGAIVANRRKHRGYTQQEIADVAGVGRRFIIDLEKGKATSEIGKILLVIGALGLDLSVEPR